jgi:DnaJ-class molecular chaperone
MSKNIIFGKDKIIKLSAEELCKKFKAYSMEIEYEDKQIKNIYFISKTKRICPTCNGKGVIIK